MNKYKNGTHRLVGRVCGVFLLFALLSGFALIYIREIEELLHITANLLSRVAIASQGYCIVGICLNAFILQRWCSRQIF